jgi:hypothetical protein
MRESTRVGKEKGLAGCVGGSTYTGEERREASEPGQRGERGGEIPTFACGKIAASLPAAWRSVNLRSVDLRIDYRLVAW